VKGVPGDYYRRLQDIEASHWWAAGMRRIAGVLLAGRTGGALLDAGCGTGGFLRHFAARFERLCGTDLSAEAIQLARQAVPQAELHVAPLHLLPFGEGEFDVAVLNDVLQHVHEEEVQGGLHELRRVLRPTGTLLVRTNGGRAVRRVRPDWRLYDAASLADELRRGGFGVERVTYANATLSRRGPEPAAPTEGSCGIPARPGRIATAAGAAALAAEAAYLRAGGRLSSGHTLFAVARPA
jgi:SAM-dependent methyltransferase